MRYQSSIFRQILKPLSQRSVGDIAARHNASAYDKKFRFWDHLVAMIYAQLAHAQSLREIEAAWNANSHQHYHLGTGPVARATLADANKRRPVEAFAEVFTKLSAEAGRTLRRECAEMVRIIDSSPIPLHETVACRTSNGRINGAKLHTVYDAATGCPCQVDITAANVNDIEIGKTAAIENGMTLVFDKGYCSYHWWSEIHDKSAFFVTRLKTNARVQKLKKRALTADERQGCGFIVTEDVEIKLIYMRNPKLDLPVRRIRVKRESGGYLTLITNDMKRTAVEVANLYKARWQIELLFRWIKQHLNLKTFLGRSENAIKLQIYAAMIAYLLLQLAARASSLKHTAIRFAELAGRALFIRKPMVRLDKPPEVNPSKAKPKPPSNQIELNYA